jgi:hypothetical protein
MADNFKFELSEPPPGITLRSTSPTADGIEMVFQGDPEKAKAGLQGNLIVNVLAGRNLTLPKKPNTRANQRRAPIGTLPAIPFEIVEHRLTRTSP